jgi:hypothetical protein
MATIQAKWTKILDAEILQRSSQAVFVIDRKIHIFGGELRPREPRDNDIHIVSLDNGKLLPKLDYYHFLVYIRKERNPQHHPTNNPTATTLTSTPPTNSSPSPRVGTAATTLNGKVYLFSGRGGTSMSPIEEDNGVWEFNPSSETWSLLTPVNPSSAPAARSYHCTASDGKDTIFIHAGCPAKGRLSDLWAFSVSRKQWTELASAPAPARGGTSIAFVGGRLYRMNGFDGEHEQGGRVDVYEPGADLWSSWTFIPDGQAGPAPRSVGALLPVVVTGRVYLVTLFGERDPSSLGHQGAGKILGDVWVFDVESKIWAKVVEQGDEQPDPRGWFGADVFDAHSIVVQGGLGEANNRLGDIWSLDFA